MSDLEKTGGAGKSLVMVEQTEDNDHKPYRPTKLEESSSTDQHHKLSTVPAIIPSAENLKEVANASSVYMKPKLSETETDMSSKNKKLRKQHEKSKSPIETIALERIEVDVKGPGENFSPMPVLPTTSVTADIKSKEISAKAAKEKLEKSFDDDSIIEQAPEPEASPASKRSRTPPGSREHFGRSESHTSIVSRAVRRIFCCGFSYRAPSEDDISTHSFHAV